MNYAEQIINTLGGYRALSHAIQEKPITVYFWLKRASIPAKYDKTICSLFIAQENNITERLLAELRDKNKS